MNQKNNSLLNSNRRDCFRQIVALLPDTARFRFLQISDHEINEARFQELGTALSQSVRRGELSRRAFMKVFGIVGAGGLWSLLFPHRSEAWQTWTGFWQNTQNNPAATYTGPDPYWDYVTLLLQFDGANGSTLFPDESNVGKTPTINGAPYIDTSAGSSPYSGRTGSAKLNSSTDYLHFGANSDFLLSGDFTISTWIKLDSILFSNDNYATIVRVAVDVNNFIVLSKEKSSLSNKVYGQVYVSGVGVTNMDTTVLAADTWHHLALTRSGTTLTLFINGVQKATAACSQGMPSNPTIDIGASGQSKVLSLADFRIYNGVATYTANFTPRTAPIGLGSYSDPYWGYCVLACPFDSSLKDCSGKSASIALGSPSLTTSITKFGTASATFDGSSYISFADTDDWTFGTADYTIEAWIRPTSLAAGNYLIAGHYLPSAPAGSSWALYYGSSNILLDIKPNGISAQNLITAAHGMSVNTWYHIAVARSAGTTRIFVQGQIVGSASDSNNYENGTPPLGVGGYSTSSTNRMVGQIDSLRITKGYARYTTDFVPPSVAFPVGKDETVDPFWSSTVLAMHMDDLTDATGRHAITNNGSVTNSTSVCRYGTASAALSGSSQFLSLADSTDFAFGSGDFTIEFFAYSNSSSGSACLVGKRSSSGGIGPFLIWLYNGIAYFYLSSNGSSWDLVNALSFGTIPVSAWTHLAVTRKGSTVTLFRDGAVVNTASTSSALVVNAELLRIGGESSSSYFNGYVDELRITKGVARYVQSFAAPTRAFATVASTATTPSMVTSGLVANLDAGDSASLVSATSVSLLSYSEQFDNATWVKSGGSVSANVATAPNGSTTAAKLTEDSSSGQHFLKQTVSGTGTVGATYTLSVYAKAGERASIALTAYGESYAVFDLNAGTYSLTGGGYPCTMTSVGSGWYRCAVTITRTSTNANWFILLWNSSNNYAGDGSSGLYIWGAQLEAGTSATPYVRAPATTTNLLTYSEQFDNAIWTKTRSSITANSSQAPDGNQTADKVVEDTSASNSHYLAQNISVSSGTTYCYSIYAKAAERTKIALQLTGTPLSSSITVFVDLSNGSVITGTATVTLIGSGWYRISIYCTTSSSGTLGVQIYALNSSGSSAYTGDGSSGLYIWGAQLEVGTSATAYIPTTTSSASRYSSPQTWTNLLTYSEQADNAAWSKSGGTVTANTTTAPDGASTADTFLEDSSTGFHYVNQSISYTAGTTVAGSWFVKANGRTCARLTLQAASDNIWAQFDLSAGTLGMIYATGTGSVAGAWIQSVGNGWYRISLSGVPSTSATSVTFQINTTLTSTGSGNIAGDTSKGLYLWGAQLEQASEPGPYIATTSASASFTGTRAWRNTVESPADGSPPTAYDFQLGGTLASAAPTPYSVSGGKSANDLIQFDGNDLLATPSIPSFVQSIHKANAKYTIEFAGRGFPLAGSGVYPCVISTLGGEANGATKTGFEVIARSNSNNTCYLNIMNAGTGVYTLSITMDHSGFWHIAFAVDAQAGTYAMIANGKTTTGSAGYSSPATTDSTRNFEIGRTNLTSCYLLSGTQLYFVRIYNRALTTTELTQNWTATRGRFGI